MVDTGLDELRRSDFAPFRALRDAPWGMTAHVLFSAIDPDRPASASAQVVGVVIRGEIGFDGFEVEDRNGAIALDLMAQEGERLDPVEIAKCLDWTIEHIETA